jgi:predicted HTH domain antitoxin
LPGKEWLIMEKVIRVEIPEHWLQGLDWDQGAVVQEIIQLGTYQLKVRRALEMYQAGAGSLGYVAEQAGLSKRDLIREARARDIEPPFDEQTVGEELGVQV